MKKRAVFLMFLALFFFSISGCGKKDSSVSPYRAVVGIDIVTKHDGHMLRRHYTDPEKMQYVLTFLRLLKPVGTPELDPEALTQDMFLLVLTRSDGSRVYYRQTGHRYFARDTQDWFCIAPEQAVRLYELLAHMPGDDPEKLRKNTKTILIFERNFVRCRNL